MWEDAAIPLAVVIVDDEPGFRLIARELLEVGDFDVVGEACSGAEAISAARALRPDVVLLDVRLPDSDGFTIAALLTQVGDGPCVVLCSVRAAEDYDGEIARCGAAGFVTKSELSAEVLSKLVAEPSPQ